jgi:hypothetical protein
VMTAPHDTNARDTDPRFATDPQAVVNSFLLMTLPRYVWVKDDPAADPKPTLVINPTNERRPIEVVNTSSHSAIQSEYYTLSRPASR